MQEITYNMHGLWPDNFVTSQVIGNYTVEVYDNRLTDVWSLHHVMIQVGYLLLGSWIAVSEGQRAKPYAVAYCAYIVVQIAQTAGIGNLQRLDFWWDLLMLTFFGLTAYLWNVMAPRMRVVWNKYFDL